MKQNESLPEEYLLACRAKAGDQEALSTLTEHLRVPLFGLAYAELHHFEDAQDVVAATLLQICLHIKELREPARMRSWTWEVARNEVRRLVERRRIGSSSEITWEILEDDLPAPFSIAAIDQSQILRLDIERALKKLPTTQAEAAYLHYLLGHSLDEIAERFGRPLGTVKSWLHHARHRLAREMESYSPIRKDKTMPKVPKAPLEKPPLKALIVQTNLEESVLTKLTDVLRSGGFQVRVFSAEEIHGALQGASDAASNDWFGLSLLVLDEVILGRPALEYLVNWRAQQETQSVPIFVLLNAAPSPLTASAYFGAGAARLVVKSSQEAFNVLENPVEMKKTNFSWVHYTEKARRVVHQAQIEARRFKHILVLPEHLLLGMTSVPDSVGARVLTEKLGLSLETIREAVNRDAPQGTDETQRDMQLAPSSKRVIDLAYEEASILGNSYIGVEHFLLGILRENDSVAADVLKSMGAELEQTRRLVREWQQKPD